jgi:hypothetical protein
MPTPSVYNRVAAERDELRRIIDMVRARLLDARDHIKGGAVNVALTDINRALELSDPKTD